MHLKLFLLLSLALSTLSASEEDLYSKPLLSKKQLQKKRDGYYFTGLPLLNYDADKGVGYGARVFFYDNGKKEDTLFKYTPYKNKIYLQFFQTTNGYSNHKLFFDSPYIANSLFRFSGEVSYEKNTQANYFGVDTSSLNNLSDPLNNSYKTAYAQQNALNKQGSPYYNRYYMKRPKIEMNLARDIFGGSVRLSIGTNVEYTTIKDYNNSTSQKNEHSKLYDERENIIGFEGGWDNAIKLSAVYDSRDFAPNPKNGSMYDFTISIYDKLLGSDFQHQRYSLSSRNFFTSKKLDFITVAIGTLYCVQTGDTPFFNMNLVNFADDSSTGLGGSQTLRGYAQDRFVGDVKALGNFELRLNFYERDIFGQSFEFMAVPFVDSGKVFDHISESDLTAFKYTYGLGLRIAWNQATIITVDYGKSIEDSGLYINFGHIF